MKLRDLLPPVVTHAVAGLVQRSLGVSIHSWLRGDDLVDGHAVRLSRPYAQSAWIHSAVNAVAGEISGRPLRFMDGKVEHTEAAFDDWWKYPAWGPRVTGGKRQRLSQAEVLRDLASWAKLEGEFFLLFDDAWALASLRGGKVAAFTPFIIAHPQRVRMIVLGGELQGYEYTDTGGRRMVYLPDQVIHWRAFNPYDDWRGLGDLEAATVAAEASFYTGTYIRELMRNNGDQGYIVVGKNGVADDKQREQIVADLRAKRAALRAGIAKDLFLTGEITIERPKEQAASTDLNASKGLSQQEVYVAFGVPPSFAEVKASYSVGKDSDYYQLIIRTCQPLGAGIASALAVAASRMSGRQLSGLLYWDDHPVMIEVRNGRVETAIRLSAVGMPMKHANDFLGLGMKPYPGWEIGYIPFSVIPVGGDGSAKEEEPSKDPTLAEEEGDGAPAEEPAEVKSLRTLLMLHKARRPVAAKANPEKPAPCAHCCAPLDGLLTNLDATRDAKEVALWREHMRKRRDQVKGFESRFRRVLMLARREVLENVAAAAAKKTVITKTNAVDLIFDLASFTAELRNGMRKQQTLALDAAGQQVMAELGKDDPFQFAPQDVLSFIDGRDNKISGIAQDTHRRVLDSIGEGVDAGETMDELAGRVRAEFNEIDRGRSHVIAQTEVAAAFGYGRDKAMRKAGVKRKAWLTSGNDNVRESHREAGRDYSVENAIPIDEPFIVGGHKLMYPGDPAGPAGEVVNCHCVELAVADEE